MPEIIKTLGYRLDELTEAAKNQARDWNMIPLGCENFSGKRC